MRALASRLYCIRMVCPSQYMEIGFSCAVFGDNCQAGDVVFESSSWGINSLIYQDGRLSVLNQAWLLRCYYKVVWKCGSLKIWLKSTNNCHECASISGNLLFVKIFSRFKHWKSIHFLYKYFYFRRTNPSRCSRRWRKHRWCQAAARPSTPWTAWVSTSMPMEVLLVALLLLSCRLVAQLWPAENRANRGLPVLCICLYIIRFLKMRL